MIDLVIRLVALVVVPRNRLPTAAMAWLLAIFFIPVIGVLLYLAIGSPKLPADRRRKQVEMNGVIEGEVDERPSTPPRGGTGLARPRGDPEPEPHGDATGRREMPPS